MRISYWSSDVCSSDLFTNGQLITDELAKQMRQMGNVTPHVSIEGNEIISDERRGKDHVFTRSMAGLQRCLDNKLMTGVSTSLCQTNFKVIGRASCRDRVCQ